MSDVDATPGVTLSVFEPRAVPLGGLRAMQVDRVMPQRGLPTVGAWCFLDSFGPNNAMMQVLPHPHIGLQTVTWPLAGEIRHRDSLGNDVVVRPGQLNLMTAGHGVSHSEFSVSEGTLHGVQLWVALPAEHAAMPPAFEQHAALPTFEAPGVSGSVLVGTLGEVTSPATAHTPLVGADLTIAETATVPVAADHEHAVLVVTGTPTVAGVPTTRGQLAYLGTGRKAVTIDGPARVMLLGGEPFPDDLVMWWNFVGRSHEEVAEARTAWQAASARFGQVAGHTTRIPAPDLPGIRLKPRTRTPD
jgi:redox-sensitive bicupin YhaK (pirin superfamily)